MKWLIVFLFSQSLFALDYIAIPKGNCFKIKNGNFIFSKTEQEYLKTNKLNAISCAQKISTITPSIKKYFTIETNIEAISTSEPYQKEQWGINNFGNFIPMTIDDLNNLLIPGVVGEDIGVLNTKEENKVIKVAILDTGIDLTHPELIDQINYTPSECAVLKEYRDCQKVESEKVCFNKFGAIDSDHNGYPMDCHGFNITGRVNPKTNVMGDFDVTDKIGHGTHVAGIIAAKKNNFGITGVIQNVKIIPVKVLNSAPTSPERPLSTNYPIPTEKELGPIKTYGDIFARGLLYALRSGANVINMSLGWPYAVDSSLMRSMVNLAIKNNVLLVASAGNDSTNVPLFPCFYTGVICVGASNPDGSFASFSNFGSNVDVLAPGVRILSTYPMNIRPSEFNEQNGFEFDQGTSMSAPFVVGVLARLLNLNYSAEESYAKMMVGARSVKKSNLDVMNIYNKYSLKGNISLSGAINTMPRPLILPIEKTERLKLYNGIDDEITYDLKLKNYYQDAFQIKIIAGVETYILGTIFKNGEKIISLKLNTKDKLFDSHFKIPIKVFENEVLLDEYFVDINVVTDMSAHPLKQETALNLVNFNLNSATKVRTIKSSKNEIALMNMNTDTFDIAILDPAVERPHILAFATHQKIDGDLLNIFGFKDKIILQYKVKDIETNSVLMKFLYLNRDLSFDKLAEVSSKKVNLSQDISWMRFKNELVPIWTSVGFDTEKPAFNPWQIEETKSKDLYLYGLFENGLSTIKFKDTDKEFFVSTLLPQNSNELDAGVGRVILAKGKDYRYEFYFADVIEGQFKNIMLITFDKYHMIGGVSGNLSLDNREIFFYDSKKISKIREGRGNVYKLKSINPYSDIQKVHGVLGSVVLSQTQNEIQFHDLLTHETHFTTLKRFSFMPNYFFDRFISPVYFDGKLAAYIPSGLGTSLTNDLIIKIDNKVIRPALFKIIAEKDCIELNPKHENAITSLVYLCKNKIVEIPLKL